MRSSLASVACRTTCSGQPWIGNDNEAGNTRRLKDAMLGGKMMAYQVVGVSTIGEEVAGEIVAQSVFKIKSQSRPRL